MIRCTACLLALCGLLLLTGCDESATPPEGYTETNPEEVAPVEAPGGGIGAEPLDRGN